MRLAAAGRSRRGGTDGRRGSTRIPVLCAALIALLALAFPAAAPAEQASEPTSPAAGLLDAGGEHSCSLDAGRVRCWGLGFSGQLGYGNSASIGDDETPGTAGPPVDLGPGRTALALSAGEFHTCAVLDNGSVRCWGFGGNGRLGYGNTSNVGDDESPGSVDPVNLGVGRTAVAISAGGAHTCAVLDNGSVLCWGFGEDGRLGYGDQATIGDDEQPGVLAPVDLGAGRTATAISAGDEHTCALLDDKTVRCWGTNGSLFQGDGRLGYGNPDTIGDNETPGTVGPVSLGGAAVAISAGDVHTCAVLEGGAVRCWGNGVDGRNGYGNEFRIGDNELPSSVGPVAVGAAATAISAGNHTCARLTGGAVRCWGPGAAGRLGYANTADIGDNETPESVGPVVLGGTSRSISAGSAHTCARLDDASLRCWGAGGAGRLGYGNANDVGDNETPSAAGAVDLTTRAASINDGVASEGDSGTTALTFTVRLSSASDTPASVAYATADLEAQAPADYLSAGGTLTFAAGETAKTFTVELVADTADEPDERFAVNLLNPSNLKLADAQGTLTILDDDAPAPAGPPAGMPPPVDALAEAQRLQAARAADLRACRASVASRRRAERSRARRRHRRPRALAQALRAIDRTAARRRAQCARRYGRTPGRVVAFTARRASATSIELAFEAAGTDADKPPAAQGYLIKQSSRPIRSARDFARATELCGGVCRFDVTQPGARLTIRVTGLRRRATYYYAIAARDNVSARTGPRSATVRVRTG